MLYQTLDQEWANTQLAKLHPGFPYWLSAWAGWSQGGQPVFLADDATAPRVMGMRNWHRFILLGHPAALPAALDDLFHHRLAGEPAWPDPEVRQAWEAEGRLWLALELTGIDAFQQAYHAGFELAPESPQERGAYFYCLTGAPHLASAVQHPCRVVHGLELYDLMRQGVDYDASGEYTKRCLENGPSFVCEVDGRPVCWSCTHINGCLGMIYTPPEFRQRGYARSLAAFQIDYALQSTGVAHCFVIVGNTASHAMMQSLGVPRFPAPTIWRKLNWPLGTAMP